MSHKNPFTLISFFPTYENISPFLCPCQLVMAYLCFQFQHVVLALCLICGDIWCEWRRKERAEMNSVMLTWCHVFLFGGLESLSISLGLKKTKQNRQTVSHLREKIKLKSSILTTVKMQRSHNQSHVHCWHFPRCFDGNIRCQLVSAGFTVDSGMLASGVQSWQTAAPQWRF